MGQGQGHLTFQSRRQIPASSRTPARMEPTRIQTETLTSSLLSGEMRSSICRRQKVIPQSAEAVRLREQLATVCYRCAFSVHGDGRLVVAQQQSGSASDRHSGGVAVVLKQSRICGSGISVLSPAQVTS